MWLGREIVVAGLSPLLEYKKNQEDIDFKSISHTRGAGISMYTCSLCCIRCNPVKEKKQNFSFLQTQVPLKGGGFR